MAQSTHPHPYTYAEYLDLEVSSQEKHEFLGGQVFQMAGGTPEHGPVAMAVARDLGNALAGRPCRVFSSDVRVRIRATGLTTYPDLSVVCGTLEKDDVDPQALVNPVLIVEVLSPATEAYDRGAKASHYRQIPALQELMLVSLGEQRVEVHRRTERGTWELTEVRAGGTLRLTSLDVTLEVARFFVDPLAPAPSP